MGNNVVVPDRQSFETMEQVRLDATVQTILQQGNVNFKDNVTSVADLPATGNTVDDFRMTLDTGWVYKRTGTQWEQPGPFDGIYSVDVTLTPAQILDMWQNPVEIVPAPGPNKIIQTVNSIVEYSVCEGGTTDYSPATGSMLLMIGQGFGYNPSFCNSYQSRSVAGNITYNTLGQTGYITPQSPNIYSYLSFFNYITDPTNKPVNAWLVYDINNPYTPPTVGDRNVTFRYNYRILDLAFTPYLQTFPTAFTLKTICNPSSAYAPFDGTETNWAVTRLYTSSSYSILPDFVLNPVYEGAGVWNLGDGLYNAPFSTGTSIGNQGYWAVQFSCIKGVQTISFTSRGTFPGAVGSVATFNVAYTA